MKKHFLTLFLLLITLSFIIGGCTFATTSESYKNTRPSMSHKSKGITEYHIWRGPDGILHVFPKFNKEFKGIKGGK